MKQDIFLSYRTHRAAEVAPLVSGLERAGLTVWRDEPRIRHGQLVTAALKEGLASTKLLLVYCTDDYHLSDICQWELTTAWLAGLRSGGKYVRILVWMAAENVGLAREALGLASDTKWLDGPAPFSNGWEGALAVVADTVRMLPAEMGPEEAERPSWFPTTKSTSRFFVGRHALMWKLASSLHSREQVGTSGKSSPAIVQLAGLQGAGKSLLAIEYAHRFSLAYPGGIFWLDAGADLLLSQQRIRASIGKAAGDQAIGQVGLTSALAEREPYLWIVDGVAPETPLESIQEWFAPTENGRTLITSTSTKWSSIWTTLPVDKLDRDAALALLTRNDPVLLAQAEAHDLVEELGRHPFALDMLAGALQDIKVPNPLGYWLAKLREGTVEVFDLVEKLELELPTKTAVSLVHMMQTSIGALPRPARYLLSIAVAGCVSIPWSLCASLLNADKDPDELTIAVNRLRTHSLIQQDDKVISVHPIVRRAGARILGEKEIEEAAQELMGQLSAVYSDKSTVSELDQQLTPIVYSLTEIISDAKRMLLARKWMDWRFGRPGPLGSLGIKTNWIPATLPPVREPDDPWLLAWCLRRAKDLSYSELPIKGMSERIADAPAHAVDADCIRWAIEAATLLLSLDQTDQAAILTSLVQRNFERLQLTDLALSAYVINQRACYRFGDLRGAQPLQLANVAWNVCKDEAEKMAAIEDAACGAYKLGDNKLALQLVGVVMNWSLAKHDSRLIEGQRAAYLLALIARQAGQFAEARKILTDIFEAWVHLPEASLLGRTLTFRLLIDLAQSLGDRASAKEYFQEMSDRLSEAHPLGSLLAERFIEAQIALLRGSGRHEDALDMVSLLERKVEVQPDSSPTGLNDVLNLAKRVERYEILVSAKREVEADEEKRRIIKIIQSAVIGENVMARFWLNNTLGLLHIPDSTHSCLLDLVEYSLPWQSAIELFQDINWEFQHSEEAQKRIGYARRSAARLQRVVALRRANGGDEFDLPSAVSRGQLAQALAYFDPTAAKAELATIEELLPCSKMRDEDRQRVRTKIGALRSNLARH
jgi:TIR domain